MTFHRPRPIVWLAAALLLLAFTTPVLGQHVVGEYLEADFTTGITYPVAQMPAVEKGLRGDAKQSPELTWSDVLVHPGATYIAPHFAWLNLPPGDFLVVRSVDGSQSWTYTDQGRAGAGVSKEGFFATHLKGDTAIFELYSVSSRDKLGLQSPAQPWGVEIDLYGRGYRNDEIEAYWIAGKGEEMNLPRPEFLNTKSICGSDDSQEAKCYQSSEAAAYGEARAVARMLKNGAVHCTGWLIGCEGHIMTNEHCVGSQSELNSIDFEFMAEGASCSTNCKSGGACPGTIEASGGTLVSVDANLDYALIDPPGSTNLSDTYGYLVARESGAVVNERIYIPQHPAGWGKRIALESGASGDGGFARVRTTTAGRCGGSGFDVGYMADTQGGSSGSPVLGYDDNLVVALHHCGGCNNLGVPIQDVLADLGANVPNCATDGSGGGGGGGGGTTTLSNGVPVTGLSGAAGSEQFFTLDVPAGATNLDIAMSGGSGDADLYVRFGAAPTTSTYDCRPYAGGNNESCPVASPSTGTYHVMVRGYSTFSNVQLLASFDTGSGGGGGGGGGGGNSLSNGVPVTGLSGATSSEQFFTLDVPAGASNLEFAMSGGSGDADLYVRFGSAPTTSQYDCRPYAGGNNETCPFASPQAGTYHVMVRGYSAFSGVQLLASFDTGSGGNSGQTWANLSGSTGNQQTFTQVVNSATGTLTVTLSGGSGDADLYVRYGNAPTTTTYDCRPYLTGNNETCTFNPPQAGTYHLMVRAYSTFSGTTLETSFQ